MSVVLGGAGGPVEAVAAAGWGCSGQAEAGGSEPIVLGAAVVSQVSGGTARRRSSAVRKSVSHGHRAGIRSVTVRAVRVIRPGTVSSRRRSAGRSG